VLSTETNLAEAGKLMWELGAPLYGQRVFVDTALAAAAEIVFTAGTHSEAIRMPDADCAAAAKPTVGRFAERPDNQVTKRVRRPVNWRASFRRTSRE